MSADQHRVARLGLALTLLALGVWTLQRFLPALVWASILAIAAWPWYARLRRRVPAMGNNVAGPLVMTLILGLGGAFPLGFAAWQVGKEAVAFLSWLSQVRQTGWPVPPWLGDIPMAGIHAAAWWAAHLAQPDHAAALLHAPDPAHFLATGTALGSEVAHRVTLFGFTLLTLFFLFRDGDYLADRLASVINRAFGAGGERIARQVVASIHGTVDGLVLVGLGVGFIMGIVYALSNVPHPALLGMLTAMAAMVPFGAAAIVTIAAVIPVVGGHMLAGVAIAIVGAIVTFSADHFVRPVLIGGATRLPFLWVLLGILGGLESWGLVGLFLGPAIMAALILLWREWTTTDRAD